MLLSSNLLSAVANKVFLAFVPGLEADDDILVAVVDAEVRSTSERRFPDAFDVVARAEDVGRAGLVDFVVKHHEVGHLKNKCTVLFLNQK